MGQIALELCVSYTDISHMRAEKTYLDAAAELKEGFRQDMLRLPATADTKKKINAALNLAVQRVIEILGDFKHARHSDIISACRLLAQMDGRFLGGAEEDPSIRRDAGGQASKSVATELLQVLERIKPSVQ